jgi:hypothetical protein
MNNGPEVVNLTFHQQIVFWLHLRWAHSHSSFRRLDKLEVLKVTCLFHASSNFTLIPAYYTRVQILVWMQNGLGMLQEPHCMPH